ncbi:unnamed protein product [Polarella glacialis]|uniref:Uncharacterized protein n=1 Tax=Polarella glacialis TaxID=89957 RepID=A0A813M0W6_POLGL|nr:unnamed protein product [Polarella glacialis]
MLASRQGSPVFKSTLPKIESGVDLKNLSDLSELGSPLTPLRRICSGDESDDGRPVWRRQASPAFSMATSGGLFAEPAQTLLFLDWDDTLFPCSELFTRRGLPRRRKYWNRPLPPELDLELEPWRQAVEEFLGAACAISERSEDTAKRELLVWRGDVLAFAAHGTRICYRSNCSQCLVAQLPFHMVKGLAQVSKAGSGVLQLERHPAAHALPADAVGIAQLHET